MPGFEVQVGSRPYYPGRILPYVSFGDHSFYLHDEVYELFLPDEADNLHINSLFEARKRYPIKIQYLNDTYWVVSYSDGYSEIRKDKGGLDKISLYALEEFSCSEEQFCNGIHYTYQSTIAADCTPIVCDTRNDTSNWTFVIKDITHNIHDTFCIKHSWWVLKCEVHNPTQENDNYLYKVFYDNSVFEEPDPQKKVHPYGKNYEM